VDIAIAQNRSFTRNFKEYGNVPEVFKGHVFLWMAGKLTVGFFLEIV
jgi:hypothetical protein